MARLSLKANGKTFANKLMVVSNPELEHDELSMHTSEFSEGRNVTLYIFISPAPHQESGIFQALDKYLLNVWRLSRHISLTMVLEPKPCSQQKKRMEKQIMGVIIQHTHKNGPRTKKVR